MEDPSAIMILQIHVLQLEELQKPFFKVRQDVSEVEDEHPMKFISYT